MGAGGLMSYGVYPKVNYLNNQLDQTARPWMRFIEKSA